MLQQVCPASCVPCHASTLKKDGGQHGGQGSDTRNMKRHTYKKIHMKKDIKIFNPSWKGANRVNAATKKQRLRKQTRQKNTGAECESTEADWWRFSFLP
jgi:hypothetical protein